MNVLDFANKYLFKPLGIEPRSNAGCESKEDQFEYLMNKNDHGKVWFLDPTGMPTAGWGLSLSAYEMAQIGLMVLNNGVYNNTRIISEEWITKTIKPINNNFFVITITLLCPHSSVKLSEKQRCDFWLTFNLSKHLLVCPTMRCLSYEIDIFREIIYLSDS